jgi:hypothetical protein
VLSKSWWDTSSEGNSAISVLVYYILIFTCSESHIPSKLIAIRYIGGILELPTFWNDSNYHLQRNVVKKLCGRTIQLIEDIDVDSLDVQYTDKQMSSAIDSLADAILVGVQYWLQRNLASNLSEAWLRGLVELIQYLRRHVLIFLIPCSISSLVRLHSFVQAKWERFLPISLASS